MPWDDPAHEPALRAALTTAVAACGAAQWAETPPAILARYLTACYEAFVLAANDRRRWLACRERDPDWPPTQGSR